MAPVWIDDVLANDKSCPAHGRRLMHLLTDDLALKDPNRIYARIPISQSYSDGLRDVTMAAFASAVDRASWWLERQLGKAVSFPTIAYLGPGDMRYHVLILAAMKTQYKIMLPAPRNSVEGMLNLFETTKCETLLRASTADVEHIPFPKNVDVLVVPDLTEWLDEDVVVRKYPYTKSYEEARTDPAIVLHTSGSTGLPKAIVLKHGGICTFDYHYLIRPLNGHEEAVRAFKRGKQIFSAFPFFHLGGLIPSLYMPLFSELITVYPPADRPMSADVLAELLDNVEVDIGFIPPSILQDFHDTPSLLPKLGKFKFVLFAGAPLAPSAGDEIARHTYLTTGIGSTECQYLSTFKKDPEDWAYFHFHPAMKGFQLRERPDGLFDFYIVRDTETDKTHSLWYTFPGHKEYSTRDCFAKHPSKANHWLFMGRGDDVIVLSNGEKFAPKAMEDTIRDCPGFREVLIVGSGRFEIAALVELCAESQISNEEAIARLTTYVEKANASASGHAQLSKDRILFIDPERPMLRTPKGSVQRAATIKAYEKDIDELYSTGAEQNIEPVPDFNAVYMESLRDWLLNVFNNITQARGLTVDDDFFAAGVDSLQVMKIVRQLKSSSPSTKIIPSFVYANPTINKLSQALLALMKPQSPECVSSVSGRRQSQQDAIKEMFERFAIALPKETELKAKPIIKGITILLTGSTGSLGSYLLDSLLSNPSISKIYCLNRAPDGDAKQSELNAAKGLPTVWDERVTFLHATLGNEHLGLSMVAYEELRSNVSFIIHNGWPVSFTLALTSFTPHIQGVVNLISFSASSAHRPPILYISSISAVANSTVPVEESPVHDITATLPMGYGQSKYISERLLEAAGARSGVSSAICRVGQIAGPVRKSGVWNTKEWFPSMIATSTYLGKLPSSLGAQERVTWIPVDTLADITVELMENLLFTSPSNSTWTTFHHLINPHESSWASLYPTVLEHLNTPSKSKVELVTYDVWLSALRQAAESTDNVDVEKLPAVKILDFFEAMAENDHFPDFVTKRTEERSASMRALKGANAGEMAMWMEQWGFAHKGSLNGC